MRRIVAVSTIILSSLIATACGASSDTGMVISHQSIASTVASYSEGVGHKNFSQVCQLFSPTFQNQLVRELDGVHPQVTSCPVALKRLSSTDDKYLKATVLSRIQIAAASTTVSNGIGQLTYPRTHSSGKQQVVFSLIKTSAGWFIASISVP